MIFGNRRVVEEELERIRLANLPPPRVESAEEKEGETADAIGSEAIIAGEVTETAETTETEDYDEPVESVEIGFTAKDILAMIIAAFSIVLPYALVMLAVAILFVLFFFRG